MSLLQLQQQQLWSYDHTDLHRFYYY